MAQKEKPALKNRIEHPITIAVSMRVDVIESYGETRDALDENLYRWLTKAGCLPVPVPNTLIEDDMLEAWFEKIKPEAIVLSGGNNIGDFKNRDETERFLLDKAKELHIPLLGICRGMQMMAVWAGEELQPVDGHVRTRHNLTSETDGFSMPESVNSYHDYGVMTVPRDFVLIARNDDGVIEAIRHSILPIEGWMWHPEREKEFNTADFENLKRLIETKNK
jgi:N5-(cytidine 5'-diphosphoramidyl)-L-glutamine hydrolase